MSNILVALFAAALLLQASRSGALAQSTFGVGMVPSRSWLELRLA